MRTHAARAAARMSSLKCKAPPVNADADAARASMTASLSSSASRALSTGDMCKFLPQVVAVRYLDPGRCTGCVQNSPGRPPTRLVFVNEHGRQTALAVLLPEVDAAVAVRIRFGALQ